MATVETLEALETARKNCDWLKDHIESLPAYVVNNNLEQFRADIAAAEAAVDGLLELRDQENEAERQSRESARIAEWIGTDEAMQDEQDTAKGLAEGTMNLIAKGRAETLARWALEKERFDHNTIHYGEPDGDYADLKATQEDARGVGLQ